MVLFHCPRTNNVLAMYWVSTSPLAPSGKVLNNLTAKFITLEECVEDVQKKAFPKVRESNVGDFLFAIDDFLYRLLLRSLMRTLPLHRLNRWWHLLSVLSTPLEELVPFVVPLIVELNIKFTGPPV